MKKMILSLLVFGGAFSGQAQETVTVSLGPSTKNAVFYSFDNSEQGTIANDVWDLSFDLQFTGASIRTNSASGVELYHFGEIGEWNDVDTVGMGDWEVLDNSPTDWYSGATMQTADPTDAFDYGWGRYEMDAHAVVGNKVYVIVLQDGSVKKIRFEDIEEGTTYNFTYADIDGSNEVHASVYKPDFTSNNRLFGYFSFETGEQIDFEPVAKDEWDFLFTPYTDMAENPIEGGFEMHGVSGILTNVDMEVAQVDDIDDVDSFTDWGAQSYSKDINVIGYDWKVFDMETFQYVIAENRVYFVKSVTGDIWKIIMLNYGGGQTGDMTFSQEKMSTLSVNENGMTEAEVIVSPNPATTKVSLVLNNLNSKEIKVNLVNMGGQIVYENEFAGKSNFEVKNISIDTLNSGIYFVNVQTENQSFVKKLVIQ